VSATAVVGVAELDSPMMEHDSNMEISVDCRNPLYLSNRLLGLLGNFQMTMGRSGAKLDEWVL
jgi:hypothetical protein